MERAPLPAYRRHSWECALAVVGGFAVDAGFEWGDLRKGKMVLYVLKSHYACAALGLHGERTKLARLLS